MFAPERISRFLSYLLRHRPKEYALSSDGHGFAAWNDVVDIVQERFQEITEPEIRAVVAGSDKQVSIYLDGVYISSPRGSISTWILNCFY